jgi:hypothetical protein
MGQTPGGALTRIDACTGAPTTVPFDTVTSPFTAQLAAFGADPWPLQNASVLQVLVLLGISVLALTLFARRLGVAPLAFVPWLAEVRLPSEVCC